jgi:hypothetical protein
MAEHLSAAVMGRKLSSILVEAEEDAPCGSKVVGTLGPQSRSVDVLERLLGAGMTAARFDFSWGDDSYHQETLDNLLTVRGVAVGWPSFTRPLPASTPPLGQHLSRPAHACPLYLLHLVPVSTRGTP